MVTHGKLQKIYKKSIKQNFLDPSLGGRMLAVFAGVKM